MTTRTIGVRLQADVADFNRNMRGAGNTVQGFVGELDRAAKAGRLDAVADQAGRMGLVAAGAFALVTKAAMDFDKRMSAVSAATHASAADMDRLRDAALAAGKSTQYSATEAARGVEELAKAGISTQQILGGGLKGALDLAAAGSMDVGEAAEAAASALTQFKLKGSDVPHVADLLAAAAGKAQGDVGQMSQALNQSGLVAAQMGLSVEETTGTLAAFASAGLLGSDAGTSFKTSLLMLANPTDKAAGLMKDLGINAYDAQGKFVGVSKLSGQLQTKLSNLTQEQRNSALATIFGSDAIRAAAILYEQGSQGIDKWVGKVNDQGFAADTARTKTDNLAGDIERLTGSLETMAIEAGSGANGGLRILVQAVDGLVSGFSNLPGPVQSAAVVLTGVSGAALLAAAGFLKARKTGQEVLDALTATGPMGEKAATGLGRVAGVAGRLGLLGMAVVGAYEGFKLFGDWVQSRHAPVKANIDDLTESIRKFSATGQITGELAAKYGAQLQLIGQDVSAVTKGMADLERARADVAAGLSDPSVYENWNPTDPQAVQRVADLDAALTQLVTNGGATQARIFLQQLQGSGALTAAQFQQLTGMLPTYTKATGSAAVANSGLAQGFGTTTANTAAMTSGLRAAIDAGQKFTEIWNQLHGATLSSDQQLLAAKNSIDAVAKSFKENGNAIEGNSKAALENRIAVGEAARQAAAAATGIYEKTGSIEQAKATYDGLMNSLFGVTLKGKLTDEQIKVLRDTFGTMPPLIVDTNLPHVTGQVGGVGTAIERLPGEKWIDFHARTAAAAAAVAALQEKIDAMRDHYVTIGIRGLMSGVQAGIQSATPKRYGGISTPAAAGLLRAEIAPPGTRYQWAEPETGGEAFVPKRGDRDRGLSILGTAASWYNAAIVPMLAGGVTAAASGLVNVAPKSSTSTLTGTRLESDQAYLAARDSLASFNTAIKENGRSLSVSTAKGRENRRSLYDAIGAAQAAARAKYEETGSVQQANEAYRLHIDRLKGTLTQQKVNASEANKILAAVAGPPKYDTPEAAAPKNSSGNIAFVKDRMAGIEAEGKARDFFDASWGKPTFSAYTATGRDELNALFDYLAAAEGAAQARYAQTGNVGSATSLYNQSLFTLRGILNKAGMSKAEIDKLFASYGQITLKANRMGGLYEHAQTGLLRDAHIAGARQTLYAYAEPATGGELFAPKYGNLQKTKEQVGWAVENWWGGTNPWQPSRGSGSGGGGKTVVVNATIPIQLGNETIVRTVRFEVDTALGALADAQIYATAG